MATPDADSRGCPVIHTDYRVDRPLMETYSLLNADRDRAPFLLNDSARHQFWMITEYDHVVEALQLPEVFGNEVLSALTPKHTIDLLPNYLNPPEHTAMRRVLNRWFSPAAVRRMEPLVLSRCTELIDELAPKGECDLVSEFAIRFPTDMFLATLNLPVSDGEEFLVSVEKIFKAFAGQGME
jgi:cytochrome P450